MSLCPGVTVVVDSHPGVREVCDASGGGKTAAELFTRNGWPLTRVTSDPAFVCRVGGKPADLTCGQIPPADAYWSLWIATGPGQPWTYATLGAYSLTVPKGGAVAFSWDDRPGDVPPSVKLGGAAPTARATATAAPSAAAGGSSGPGGGLPGWVAPGVIALLLLAALAVAAVRRWRS